MLHVRLNRLTSDPDRLGESISFIESEVRDRVYSRPGGRGLSLHTNPVLGTAVIESFWISGDALRASEQTVSSGRRQAARLAAGIVAVERFQLPVFERDAPLEPDARLLLTRMDIEPILSADCAVRALEEYGLVFDSSWKPRS